MIPNSTKTPKESRSIAEVQSVSDHQDIRSRFQRYRIAAILKGSTRLQLKLAKEELQARDAQSKERAVEHALQIQALKAQVAQLIAEKLAATTEI